MAIEFLNKVDLNQNELDKARIVNELNDGLAGTGVEGQLYFNTTDQVLKIWKEILPATTPKTYEWISVSGDITDILPGTYINITNQTGPKPTINHDLTTRPADSNNGDASPGYGGTFTMIDSVTTNSTGHVTLANLKTITLPAASSRWTAAADTGTPLIVSYGDTVNFLNDTNGGIDLLQQVILFLYLQLLAVGLQKLLYQA